MAKCKQCNAHYKPKRSTSLYCSAKCRVYHNRGVSVTDSVTDKENGVTLRDKSVTLSKTKPKTPKDKTPLPNRFDMCPKHNTYKMSCGCR